MDDIKRTTVCQCTKCNVVIEYKGGEPVCPECRGRLHFIRLSNLNDEIFLDEISSRFND